MKTKLLVAALFAATAGAVVALPHLEAAPAPAIAPPAATPAAPAATPAIAVAGKPRVDVVFVLDTTGSMSGLIDAAKENIWAIASSMAKAQPAPEIRIGLVAFRDRGDEYVTRVTDLSADLDSMYATLMDLRADGGGDTPESVNQALYDAVHRMSWSQDDSAYQVIFLVGDAPAQMGYPDDVKYPDTIRAAMTKGIVVNTILAGVDPTAQQEWVRIAGMNQGRHFQVGQQGDAIAVTTPFDVELASLSRQLDDTRLYYGDATAQAAAVRREAATDKLHAAGSVAAQAKRAMYNASAAGKVNLLGDNELVDAVSHGRVDLDAIATEELPTELRGLDRDAREKAVADAAATRRQLDEKIKAVSDQRQAFIAEELAKRDDTAQSLDAQIFDAVKEQAGRKGLSYSGAPVH